MRARRGTFPIRASPRRSQSFRRSTRLTRHTVYLTWKIWTHTVDGYPRSLTCLRSSTESSRVVTWIRRAAGITANSISSGATGASWGLGWGLAPARSGFNFWHNGVLNGTTSYVVRTTWSDGSDVAWAAVMNM